MIIMRPVLAAPILLLWVLATRVEAQADGSFWWLKDTTDDPAAPTPTEAPLGGVSTPKKPPCECVEYYLCVNGTISTSGVGLIDIRLGANGPPQPPPPRNRNANQCPNPYDVCCDPPPKATTPGPTTTPEPTLPPDTPCECVSFINCTVDRIVNDGKGNATSLEALGFSFSHSSCPHAFTVCCALDPTTIPTKPSITTSFTTVNPAHPHCDCVDPTQCDAFGNIITSGIGLIDLRGMNPNPNPHIECEEYGKMCCNIPKDDLSTDSSSFHSTTITTPVPTTVTVTTPSACGSRNEMGVAARILGFKEGESQFGEFPWVTAVLRREIMMGKPVHLFVGGGTLIHPKIVITAAHKVEGIEPSKIWVRLGEWDTMTTYEAHEHQNIQVDEVVVHPKYVPRVLFNDIALLILKEEAMEMAPHIGHICLTEDLSQINTTACIINGWGKDGFEDKGQYQTIMKSLTLPMVDNGKCQNQLRKTRLGPYFSLHRSFVCAGGEIGVDACTGDGGGPLACPRIDDPKRYLLVGMTAWGIGCGQDGVPGVYVSIPANYHWIVNETYGRYPTPTTVTSTTSIPTTTPLSSTTTSSSSSEEEWYEDEEDDYELDYENWREERRRQEKERKRRRKQLRKERKQREKEEKRRRRERRRGQEQEK